MPDTSEVPISWEALEDAFENNAPEVNSFLHLTTGEVVRVVDGVAEPGVHRHVSTDTSYLRIDPVSSREQYRWMERFIETCEDDELQSMLAASIDGKGAFRRFKDVLLRFPVERERWFTFRSARLRACMEAWLTAHALVPVARPDWDVPTTKDVADKVADRVSTRSDEARVTRSDARRRHLHELVDGLALRDLDSATSYLTFLKERRPLPRPNSKSIDANPDAEGDESKDSE